MIVAKTTAFPQANADFVIMSLGQATTDTTSQTRKPRPCETSLARRGLRDRYIARPIMSPASIYIRCGWSLQVNKVGRGFFRACHWSTSRSLSGNPYPGPSMSDQSVQVESIRAKCSFEPIPGPDSLRRSRIMDDRHKK